jgi:hypothetical protein
MDLIFASDQRDIRMSACAGRCFCDSKQVHICCNHSTVVDRYPLTAVAWQQTVTHLQVRLHIGKEIGVESVLLVGR